MKYFLWYICAGLSFSFMIQAINDFILNKRLPEDERTYFKPWEIVVITIFWPIHFIVFVYGIIKTLIGK